MMKTFVPLFVRSGNNYDMKAVSDADGFACVGESRTQQQFREECDINTIVRRFGVTGTVPTTLAPPLQGDFQDALDFRQSMDLIVAARESFQAMPSEVRKRFHHDPAEFVDFCSNPDNLVEARKWGLARPEPVIATPPPPVRVEVVAGPSVKPEGTS